MRSLFVLLLLAGCATKQPQYVWEKPGATEQEFYADRGQCQAQGYAVPQGPMSMQAMMVFGSCMQGRGWRSVPKN